MKVKIFVAEADKLEAEITAWLAATTSGLGPMIAPHPCTILFVSQSTIAYRTDAVGPDTVALVLFYE